MKYIIQDWAGNHLFQEETFDTFGDGWSFIYENVDNSEFEATQSDDDDAYQDYFVVNKK